jgi:nucleotide-binding universal stress UspA family protein
MVPLKKILLPVDFSSRCYAAAHYARALSAHFGSQITVLHVPEGMAATVGTLTAGGGYVAPTPLYRFENELSAFVQSALPGLQPRSDVVAGDPAKTITAYASEHASDLIVLPTHGRSPAQRFLLGSVTAKVLAAAACSVCTGAHWTDSLSREAFPPEVVLCAIDLGPSSQTVLSWASQMALECKAKLVIVHAASEDRALATQQVGDLQTACGKTAAEATVWVDPGEPVRVVFEAAEQYGAGMVVIGRSAEKENRLQQNAYAIIRHAPCPVFSI